MNADFPPVFIMTCPGDFLKYQAPYMMETLMDKDVPFDFRFYGNADNPLTHVFHCNVRLEDGRNVNDLPAEIIYEAASIAAFHSKASGSTNVPVDYVPVRYVRKPNGAKPGMVIFTHNKTVYVDPKLPDKA